jgi:hypothetical protein
MSRHLSLTALALMLVAGGCTDRSEPTAAGTLSASLENAPEASGPVVRSTFGFVDSFVFDDTPDGEEWILFVGLPEDISQLPRCGGPGTDDRLTIQQVILEGRMKSIEQRLGARAVAYNNADFEAARDEVGLCAALQMLTPIAEGTVNFTLQDNDQLAQTRNNVWGWSLIGQIGSYSVHQVVRLQIMADEFTVLQEDSYIR